MPFQKLIDFLIFDHFFYKGPADVWSQKFCTVPFWWGEQSELNQSPIFVADLSETVLNFSFSDNLGPLFVTE